MAVTVDHLSGGRLDETIERLDAACAEIGRDPAELRHASECQWTGESREELLDICGRTFERGFTELVITLYRPGAAAMASRAAEALPELRRLPG